MCKYSLKTHFSLFSIIFNQLLQFVACSSLSTILNEILICSTLSRLEPEQNEQSHMQISIEFVVTRVGIFKHGLMSLQL